LHYEGFCTAFLRAAEDRINHYQNLDTELSRFLCFTTKSNEVEDPIVDRCEELLERMLKAPPPFTDAHRFW
jgi:hypothetical protein